MRSAAVGVASLYHVGWICNTLPSRNSNVTHRLGYERFVAAVSSLCLCVLAETLADLRVGDGSEAIPRSAWSTMPSLP